MAESPQQERLYSIVVVGAMNPRIHHPLWYRSIGQISEEECAGALATPSLIVVPTLAQLEFSGITVVCQLDRWEIRTFSESLRPRILEIACEAFTRLGETPVSLFGLNTKIHKVTSARAVKERLAEFVVGLPLGLARDGAKSCALTFTNAYDSYSVNIEIAPSPLGENLVFVGYNTERRAPSEGHFDLAPLLRRHYDDHLREAMAAIDRVARGLAD